MTELAQSSGRSSPGEGARCRWCGRPLPDRQGPGRPRVYCRQGCRQAAHVARKLAAAHGLGPNDVIVDRAQLDELQGHLYCLQAALEDVARDVGRQSTRAELAEALRWVRRNAEPLVAFWLEPRAAIDAGPES